MANDVQNKITSGLVWRFGERFAAQIVSFVVSIILARILTPDDYGVVALVNVFISIADVLVNNGLNSALIQKQDATDEDFSTIFYCNFLLSGLLYVILFVSAPYVAMFYAMPQLTSVIRVFGLRLLPAAFNAIQIAYVSKRMEFRKFFWSTLGGTVISAIVGIVMALNGAGVYALVAQYMTNTVVDTTILFITVGWRPKLVFQIGKAIPMIKFGMNVMGANLIGTIFNQLNSFIIGKRYTSADLAYYDKGKNLPQLLTNNVSTAVQSVLFPAMSNAKDNEEVKAIARKSTRYMSFMLFPCMVGLAAVAEPLIKFLLTDKWLAVVPFLRLICIDGMIGVIDSTNGLQVLKARGYGERILKLEFMKKPIAIGIILIAMNFGVMGIAISVPLTSFVIMFINTGAASKITHYTVKEQVLDVLPAFIPSVVMGIGVFLLSGLRVPVFILLVLQVVCGAAIYICLAILIKNKEFYGLWNMVKGKIRR